MPSTSSKQSLFNPHVFGIESQYCRIESESARGGPSSSAFFLRWGLAVALAGQGMFFNLGYNMARAAGEGPQFGSPAYLILHLALLLAALGAGLLLGGPLWRNTIESIQRLQVSVEALFVLSAVGALVGSLIASFTGEGAVYYEVIAVVFCVYALGKHIGVQQKGKVTQAIAGFRQAFDFATVETPDYGRRICAVDAIAADAIVCVGPGDAIAVDGLLVEGRGYVRETSLTGEPAAVIKQPGDPVFAGTWSLDGNLRVRPQVGGARRIDQILAVMEQARQRPSQLQQDADRLMRIFVPAVCMVSLATFLGWSLLGGLLIWQALLHAMAVLLVACPCALGLATPAGIWAGLFHLGQRGLLARNGPLLDTLARCTDIVFDKTGTLTGFDLVADTRYLRTPDDSLPQLAAFAASLADQSPHPVSRALACLSHVRLPVDDFSSYPGEGIAGRINGHAIVLGELSLLQRLDLTGWDPANGPPQSCGKPVFLAVDGRCVGFIALSEQLRPDADAVMQELAKRGLQLHILSGDPHPAFAQIAATAVQSGLTAHSKAQYVKALRMQGRVVLFVGDGINDLAAMEAADSALAVDFAAAMASEFADGILLQGRLAALPHAIILARRLRQRLRANLVFALLYNLIGIALAAAGMLHPVVAALLMVGSSFIVSMRSLHAAAHGA